MPMSEIESEENNFTAALTDHMAEDKKGAGGRQAGTGFTNISTIILSFFYLFSKLLLNCFQLLAII
jgi:hypothetical protein